MMPTKNSALTGSNVGALGTAGEMSTAAIAIKTASASKLSARWSDASSTPSLDGLPVAPVAKNLHPRDRRAVKSRRGGGSAMIIERHENLLGWTVIYCR